MLTREVVTSIVQAAAQRLQQDYVFPERGEAISHGLLERLEAGHFDATTPDAFADQVTEVLFELSSDRHVRLRHHPHGAPDLDGTAPDPAEVQRWREELRTSNFGFQRVERLPGNIGLLELHTFAPTDFAAETAIAAMQFLAHTDALIIDLRKNGGGDPQMIQLISTYLFDEPTHLNSFYFRPQDQTWQTWTLPYVPGKRLLTQPVYVLTSGYTFSAAEEFSYNLKHLGRATLVGEVTRGGAHPGNHQKIHKHFTVFVPTGRTINPITGGNWEGTGVEPHLQVPASEALDHAHREALQQVLQKLSDRPEHHKQRAEIEAALSTSA